MSATASQSAMSAINWLQAPQPLSYWPALGGNPGTLIGWWQPGRDGGFLKLGDAAGRR